MVQQRDPPAYQEYAASLIARTEYRVNATRVLGQRQSAK
jgi:hypothetical protein